MARKLGRQLNRLFEVPIEQASEVLSSWVAVEIDASVHDLSIFDITAYVRWNDQGHEGVIGEAPVYLIRDVKLQLNSATSLLQQISNNNASEILWGGKIDRFIGATNQFQFFRPFECAAGHKYTVGINPIGFSSFLAPVFLGLTVHGELKAAGVATRL